MQNLKDFKFTDFAIYKIFINFAIYKLHKANMGQSQGLPKAVDEAKKAMERQKQQESLPTTIANVAVAGPANALGAHSLAENWKRQHLAVKSLIIGVIVFLIILLIRSIYIAYTRKPVINVQLNPVLYSVNPGHLTGKQYAQQQILQGGNNSSGVSYDTY